VFLSLPPEQAFLRKGGVDKTDRVELSGMEFHNKVYGGYLDLAKKYPERFLVIDASGSKEQTHEKVISALKEKGII
jgi:dTMP kinase